MVIVILQRLGESLIPLVMRTVGQARTLHCPIDIEPVKRSRVHCTSCRDEAAHVLKIIGMVHRPSKL